MVIVQRIVVRWTKEGRGAVEATRRREIPAAFELPPMPDAPLAVHDVLAEHRTGYVPTAVTGSIAHRRWQRDLFLTAQIDHDKDERVSLYGGPR